MLVTIALVVVVVAALLFWTNSKPSSYPPGPSCYPFFGNAIELLSKTPKVAFQEYTKTYGGVVSYRIFGTWNVLISDPALMRSALANPAFSDRIDVILFESRDKIITGNTSNPLGIITTSGDVWKNQRRFTMKTLKDLGLGRQALEPIIVSELQELLDYFTLNQGKKIDISLMFNRSIVNVIWAIVIGKRFSHTDARLIELVDKVNKMMQTFNPFHPALRFRWIKKIFPNLEIIKKTEGYMADLLHFIEDEMALHNEETGGATDYSSYIGSYQQAMEEAAQQGKDTPLNSSHLKANILELFLAGSETTSNTLVWSIYLLATNPEVQRTVQDELDKVVGQHNMPTLAHMDSLPYTMATMYEVLRRADLIPFAIPHQTSEETVIGGYTIPKGMCVLFNLSHGLKDPKYWEAPEEFRPQHFLNDEGKVFKPDHFLPFGSGKRVCLGESMARLELFLFMSFLLHRFSWRLSDDPVVWEQHIIFSRPPNYTVVATTRDRQAHKE